MISTQPIYRSTRELSKDDFFTPASSFFPYIELKMEEADRLTTYQPLLSSKKNFPQKFMKVFAFCAFLSWFRFKVNHRIIHSS